MVTNRRGAARRSQGGFTLIEILLVVFIIGVIAAISTFAVSNTLKKARLDQMSETVRGLVGRARSNASNFQCVVFVIVGPTGAGPAAGGNYTNTALPKRLILVADRNGNNIPDDAIINPESNNQIFVGGAVSNDDMALSSQNLAWVETNWPVYLGPAVGPATPWDNNFAMIAVDPMGRTIDPNSGVMVNQTMTLNLTHRDMVLHTLRPMQIRTIRVSPLYTVSVIRN